jgi:hypothetical protein
LPQAAAREQHRNLELLFLRRPAASLLNTLAPAFFGFFLFLANNLGAIHGWLRPPDGYVAVGINRQPDVAQYFTWIEGTRLGGLLLPNYHAPWLTEPALLTPFMWLIGQVSDGLSIDAVIVYRCAHFGLYVVAAYGLFWAVRTFTASRAEVICAIVAVVSAVPVIAFVFPGLMALGRWDQVFQWSLATVGMPTSDGFLHATPGDILMTFGTAVTLLSFALLARYLQTEQRKYLYWLAPLLTFGTFAHPFEVVVIVGAGIMTIVVVYRRRWTQKLPEVALVSIAVIGLLPHLYLTWRHPWLREIAAQNVWPTPRPPRLFFTLGFPAVAAALLLVLRPRMRSPTDVLLQVWFVWTLVALYLPRMPWAQHFLDGFHYGTALLVSRQLSQLGVLAAAQRVSPALLIPAAALWCALGLSPHVVGRVLSFRDGNAPAPRYFANTIIAADDLATISWLRSHAKPDQLILAPLPQAEWMATVPMHSFASHHLFSGTWVEQRNLAREFFAGRLTHQEAWHLIREYGMRYVLVPESSGATKYFAADQPGVQIGALRLYEIPDAVMTWWPPGSSR